MTPSLAIAAITNALEGEPRIRALFLSGSYGAGLEDAYSDIDFLMATSDGPTDEVAALWHKAVSRTGEIVLWWDRQVRPALIKCHHARLAADRCRDSEIRPDGRADERLPEGSV